ncbi:MAG: putative rane protein [Herbinix sp.]|jgi:hypothetical protein|nr:putative rane protein [Herbinix sp.]
MQNCDNCKVSLKGNYEVCPLCGGILHENEGKSEEIFPNLPTIFQEFNYLIRIMILISIAAIIISFAINLIFTKDSKWSLIVAAGIACMWVSLFFIIRKKNNIPKTIVWQVVLIGILSVMWDWSMGWLGWSINFVIPTICFGAMVVMAIAAKILKIGARDLIVYLFIDIIFGFIPIIFILTGILDVVFPSVICVATSTISLSALILFQGDNMKAELRKKMHI